MTNTQIITLITGTSRGLGKYLAQHYLNAGHIVIGCSRKEPPFEHPSYCHFSVDVSNETDVRNMFSKILSSFGKLDHLINNAGIASMNHFALMPIATVRRILETNIVGSFLFTQEAVRLMQRNRFGRIVNFSTVAVPLKLDGEAIYAASKAAVHTLTQILSKELSPFGITVNSIGPTPIATDLIKNVPKAKIDGILARQSISRLGKLEDVSNVIDFFLKPESEFITGQIIYLGGPS
jgi:3-oxoacyl-[acyl-carrier protein] reductase